VAEGVRKRHTKDCPARTGGRCRCQGGYEASVYSERDGKKIYKTFPREAEARSWRADAKRSLDQGALRAPSGKTLAIAAEAWLIGAEHGEIRNRSGHRYKPSTLRGYRGALRDQVLPAIGSKKLSAVTTADIQALVDRWHGEGQAPSTVRNSIKPLQAIYRRARAREGVPVNPTHDLELPVPEPREVQILAPNVAAELIEALPVDDRGVWATALYAGLRYGELRALRWGAVDLAEGTIRVRESWDPEEGSIAPKTRTSRRTTPVPVVLRELLHDRRARAGQCADDALVFAGADGLPFHAASLYRRADRAWLAAGLEDRLRLHQARHTYASFMIAAGVNAKALATFMGHSSIKVTFDLYGHLMPGTEAEAAALLDAFLGSRAEVSPQSATPKLAVDGRWPPYRQERG
jgi:integrase